MAITRAPMYTVDSLVESIQIRGMIPDSQQLYSPDELANMANQEMQSIVVPYIMRMAEEYFVTFDEIQLVAGLNTYPIPPGATGGKMREVAYLCANNGTGAPNMYNLPRLTLEQVSQGNWNWGTGWGYGGVVVQGNDIIIYPTPRSGQLNKIRIYYMRRPNELVINSEGAKIRSIDPNTNSIVVDQVPISWSNGMYLDSVSAIPGFRLEASHRQVVSISAPTIVLDSVADLTNTAYVAPEGYSCVVAIPVEAQHYLAELTAQKCNQGLTDQIAVGLAQAKLQELKDALIAVLTPRIDSSPKKVINLNSIANYTGGWWGNGGY